MLFFLWLTVALCEGRIGMSAPVVIDVGFISSLNLSPHHVCAQCYISSDTWSHLARFFSVTGTPADRPVRVTFCVIVLVTTVISLTFWRRIFFFKF